ncbi:hypothetical protein AB0L65_10250 [Nonomuraea sp. NPDC052116]|uniref:hypothetical protein n=1 Tax=Nonomuraea sp. NPDC052116 TaxID=3155665 RepID=UPI00341A615B
MSGKGYQTLLDCRHRGRLLREHGFTVDQIVIVFSLDHPASPLRLYRYAAGLTASQVITAHAALDSTGATSLREARLYDYENVRHEAPCNRVEVKDRHRCLVTAR